MAAPNYFQVEFERLRQRSRVLMSDFYNLDNWGLDEWRVRDPALILAKRDQFQAELNRRLAPLFESVPRPVINAGYLSQARDVVCREHGAVLELARLFDGVALDMGPKVRDLIKPEVNRWKVSHNLAICNARKCTFFQRYPLANPDRVLGVCHFLDSWWQELIGHEQAVAEISHEGHVAMRAELERVYIPMQQFVREFIYKNPQQVPVFGSMDNFLNDYFETEGRPENVEQVNDDDEIPADLIFPNE